MATQGIVSILSNGEMFIKVVAGSNGFNAKKLAEWANARHGGMTEAAVYQAARDAGFGSPEDLVVQGPDGSLTYDGEWMSEEDLGPLYRDYSKFLDPRFNPRWEAGIADYVEIVD